MLVALPALHGGCQANRSPRSPYSPPVETAPQQTEQPSREGMELHWHPATTPPRPTRGTPRLRALLTLCGEGDVALQSVAESLAGHLARGEKLSETGELVMALRSEGSPYVWPRAWSLEGPRLTPGVLRDKMRPWLEAFGNEGRRRCGLAWARAHPGEREVFVAVAVEAVAELLAPVPTMARSGQWVTVDASSLIDAAGAKLLILPPRGIPYAVPASFDAGRIRGVFRVDRPGPWKAQVLASTDSGPRPALELMIWVDRSPPRYGVEEPAPGENLLRRSDEPETQLLALVMAARATEGLPPLRRDPRLDKLAREHSRAMRESGKLGHDVGAGDPLARLRETPIGARRGGENVAHAANVVLAQRALWASPSHRGNLLDTGYDAIGLGLARDSDGSIWVTQTFAELGVARAFSAD